MTYRYKLELSEQLDREFCQVAADAQVSKSEALRKALHLYIVAHQAVRSGCKVGILDSRGVLTTEFVGI